MKHQELDSIRELRLALEANRDELIASHLRLGEFNAAGDQDLTDCLVELMERNGFLLNQVLNALDRIASCRYGECLNCGEPVCAKGLAALPWVVLCESCQPVVDSRSADRETTAFHAA